MIYYNKGNKMSYTKTLWINDQAPAIDATNLNHIEDGIYNNYIAITDIMSGISTVANSTHAVTADSLTTPIVSSPLGAIIMWGCTTIPANYMECNGATLPRTHALFALYGTTWGVGDGVSTFNIPDFRGIFPRGWDHGRGVDSGRALGSFQEDAFESHSHIQQINGADAGYSHYTSGAVSSKATIDSSISTKTTGDNETRPKNNALMFLIKVS
jgi:microcystin-dependent protein